MRLTKKKKKKIAHPAGTATKSDNQGEARSELITGYLPSATKQERATSKHQTWGDAFQTQISSLKKVSAVFPPSTRRSFAGLCIRGERLSHTARRGELPKGSIIEKMKNIIKKKGGVEIKTGKHGIHGKCAHAKHGVWSDGAMEQRAADRRNWSRFTFHLEEATTQTIRASAQGWREEQPSQTQRPLWQVAYLCTPSTLQHNTIRRDLLTCHVWSLESKDRHIDKSCIEHNTVMI